MPKTIKEIMKEYSEKFDSQVIDVNSPMLFNNNYNFLHSSLLSLLDEVGRRLPEKRDDRFDLSNPEELSGDDVSPIHNSGYNEALKDIKQILSDIKEGK